MPTEKEIAINKARPISLARGLNIAQFDLVILLFEGKKTKEIAPIWGKNHTSVTIRDEIGKIYDELNKTKSKDEFKIDSHTRLFITLGLIPS